MLPWYFKPEKVNNFLKQICLFPIYRNHTALKYSTAKTNEPFRLLEIANMARQIGEVIRLICNEFTSLYGGTGADGLM